MTELFYHYTDVDGLISILTNEELWLSAIYFMDDYTEGKVVFDKIYRLVEDPNTRYKVRQLFNLCIKQDRMYAISFTKNKDQLSQWRGYCPDGGGYSIGFDFDSIDELDIVKPSSSQNFKVYKSIDDLLKNSSGQVIFESCTYTHESSFEEHVNILYELVNEIVNEIPIEKFERMENLQYSTLAIIDLAGDQEKTQKILDFFFRISRIASLYKDSSFYEEDEYRLMYIDKPLPSKPFIRKKINYPFPYIKAKFPKDAVQEIVIGPTRYGNLSSKGVYYLLNTYDIKAKISYSKIPFRD